MPAILPHITFDTAPSPLHSIIWLHGLGADGTDFVPIAEELNLPVPVRFIFPHAPKKPVTLNGGFIMRAWYDITENDLLIKPENNFKIKQDAAGIRASQAEIEKLINQEKLRGVSSSNIFLAGFSQGGVIALQTGLRQEDRIGGIIALSTYLALTDTLKEEISIASKETPIFMAHGLYDPVVNYIFGKSSAEILRQLGYKVDWHDYAMQHSVSPLEISDIEDWLTAVIRR